MSRVKLGMFVDVREVTNNNLFGVRLGEGGRPEYGERGFVTFTYESDAPGKLEVIPGGPDDRDLVIFESTHPDALTAMTMFLENGPNVELKCPETLTLRASAPSRGVELLEGIGTTRPVLGHSDMTMWLSLEIQPFGSPALAAMPIPPICSDKCQVGLEGVTADGNSFWLRASLRGHVFQISASNSPPSLSWRIDLARMAWRRRRKHLPS